MTTEDAKSYLARREIPQLFESLMTGLMYYRPEDHVAYIHDCLSKIKAESTDIVKWNHFIDKARKTPLPPISGQNGRRASGPGAAVALSRDNSFSRTTPLPPIGSSTADLSGAGPDRVDLPPCPIVLVMGGPGSGKATQCELLVKEFPGWVHLSMGDMLRAHTMESGTADDKWAALTDLVSKGEMAPEEMTVDLITKAIADNKQAKGIIIEGYPRNMTQYAEFVKRIGRADLVFMLDCEEEYLKQRLIRRGGATGRADDNENAINARLKFFKDNTLEVAHKFDEAKKLAVVDGDRDTDEIAYDLKMLFLNVIFRNTAPGDAMMPRPPSGGRPGSVSRPRSRGSRPSSSHSLAPKLNVSVPDVGRVDGLPTMPIIFVIGGPGSQRANLARDVALKVDGVAHLSVSSILKRRMENKADKETAWDEVRNAVTSGELAALATIETIVTEFVHKSADTQALIIDGFPANQEQLETFNKKIGGVSGVVLIECNEATLQKRLSERPGADNVVITNRIKTYKKKTLPVLGHYDDMGKLYIVNGEKPDYDAILKDILAAVEPIVQTDNAGAQPERLKVDHEDTGRKDGLSTCPIISLMGGPGSDVGELGKKVVDEFPGTLVLPKEGETLTLDKLREELNPEKNHSGVLLTGFPMDKATLEEFNQTVGGMSRVILIDHSETFLREKLSDDQINKLEEYRKSVLPVLGYYDDHQLLALVKGDCSNSDLYPYIYDGVYPFLTKVPPIIEVDPKDTGRKDGMPQGHLVSIIGPPTSGVDAQCKRLAEKSEDVDQLDLSTTDVTIDQVKKVVAASKAKVILLGNYPRTKAQVEDFNREIGGLNAVIVADAKENFVVPKLTSDAEKAVLKAYKEEALPVLHHYDNMGRLYYVDAMRTEDEIFEDMEHVMQRILSNPADALPTPGE